MSKYRIVPIDSDDIVQPFKRNIKEAIEVRNSREAWDQAKKFIGPDQILTTFWGTWEDKRVLFMCNDNGLALGLYPNTPATLAYLDQCVPGTMHVVVGPVVALMDEELW